MFYHSRASRGLQSVFAIGFVLTGIFLENAADATSTVAGWQGTTTTSTPAICFQESYGAATYSNPFMSSGCTGRFYWEVPLTASTSTTYYPTVAVGWPSGSASSYISCALTTMSQGATGGLSIGTFTGYSSPSGSGPTATYQPAGSGGIFLPTNGWMFASCDMALNSSFYSVTY